MQKLDTYPLKKHYNLIDCVKKIKFEIYLKYNYAMVIYMNIGSLY